jgi:hypothetical protein
LNYDPDYPSGFITMICSIKGSPFSHTCVHISENEEHVYINIDEPELGNALQTEISHEKLENVPLTKTIEEKLCVLKDEEQDELRLEWDPELWIQDKEMYKVVKPSQFRAIEKRLNEPSEPTRYQEYDKELISGVVSVQDVKVDVTIYYNTVLETLRAELVLDEAKRVYPEESYPEEFALFRSL